MNGLVELDELWYLVKWYVGRGRKVGDEKGEERFELWRFDFGGFGIWESEIFCKLLGIGVIVDCWFYLLVVNGLCVVVKLEI